MAEYIDYFYGLQEHRFTDSSPKCDETLCTVFPMVIPWWNAKQHK